jgi:hypothetical protein
VTKLKRLVYLVIIINIPRILCVDLLAGLFCALALASSSLLLTDLITGRVLSSVPSSSYRLGVKSAACFNIYPKRLYNALLNAITQHFEKQMPGFLTHEGMHRCSSLKVLLIRFIVSKND